MYTSFYFVHRCAHAVITHKADLSTELVYIAWACYICILYFPFIGFYKTFNLVIARYKMWLILNILQIYCVLECMHDIMNAVILIVTMNGNKSYMYLRLIKVLYWFSICSPAQGVADFNLQKHFPQYYTIVDICGVFLGWGFSLVTW